MCIFFGPQQLNRIITIIRLAMPSPCWASSQAISVQAFRWRIEKKTRSDHVTRNALAAPNNEAYGHGNGTVFLYNPSLSLKTLETGILFLAVFKLELEMDHPSETGLCTVTPFPTDTPAPNFSEGRGWLYTCTGYLKRIIHLQTKSDGLFIQN